MHQCCRPKSDATWSTNDCCDSCHLSCHDMSKLLLTAFALLAVANAAVTYSIAYDGTSCGGYSSAEYSMKYTLDQCTLDYTGDYIKITESSGTYTIQQYLNTGGSCSTATGGSSSGTAGFCISGMKSRTVGDSGYASGGQQLDCTSGTCPQVFSPSPTPATNSASTCKCSPAAPSTFLICGSAQVALSLESSLSSLASRLAGSHN